MKARRMTTTRIAAPLLAAGALLLAGCRSPTGGSTSGATGSLSIKAAMGAVSARRIAAGESSLVPAPARSCFPVGVDLSSITYTLTLTNASPDSPIAGGSSSTGTFATLTSVPVGAWTATVDAVDAGVTIGTGSAAVVVSAGSTASATVNLAPPSTGTGTLSLGASWPFPAQATVVITPVNPSGSAMTHAVGVVTSYANGFVLPGGEYLIEFSISTAGSSSTTQATIRESAYILPGQTTDFRYDGDATIWKDGAPAAPSLSVTPGNNGTDLNYAYVSWTGGTGAIGYEITRKEATTFAGLSSAGSTTIALVPSTDASFGGIMDNDSSAGLSAVHYYRYTLALTSSSGDTLFITADAPMATISLAFSAPNGTCTLSGGGTILQNTAKTITESGYTGTGAWSGWTVTTGAAVISSAMAINPTVIPLTANVTITANFI